MIKKLFRFLPTIYQKRYIFNQEFTRSLFVLSSEKGDYKKKFRRKKKKQTVINDKQNDSLSRNLELSKTKKYIQSQLEKSVKTDSDKYSDFTKIEKTCEKVYDEIKLDTQKTDFQNIIEFKELDKAENLIIKIKNDIPELVSNRLGLAYEYLLMRGDWKMIIESLEKNGGFNGLTCSDIKHFLEKIPPLEFLKCINKIEQLIKNSGIEKNNALLETILNLLTLNNDINDEVLNLVKYYINKIKERTKKKKLTRICYEFLIKAYGKARKIKEMNEIIKEMKDANMQLSHSTYKNLLLIYVYKIKDHDQSVKIFDAMIFLSDKTKPDTFDYQTIILSYILNNFVEKALDLYEEMITQRIQINKWILLSLAKGCISKSNFKVRGWDFFVKAMNLNQKIDPLFFETLIFMASKDGDINFSRSLFNFNYKNLKNLNNSFLSLLHSYYCFGFEINVNDPPLTINSNEKTKLLRKTFLENFIKESTETLVPFLPNNNLKIKKNVYTEFKIIWKFVTDKHSQLLSRNAIEYLLKIIINYGTYDEFIMNLTKYTFFDVDDSPKTRLCFENTEGNINFNSQQKIDTIEINRLENELSLIQKTHKIRRDSSFYCITLKAASKFRNYDFAQKMWVERGLYRKSKYYQSLSDEIKEENDFNFAVSMINFYSEMDLHDDAVLLIKKTSDRFNWSWKELRTLYDKANETLNTQVVTFIKNLVRDNQLKFKGKMTNIEFKKSIEKKKRNILN